MDTGEPDKWYRCTPGRTEGGVRLVVPGAISFGWCGPQARGRWASHTGYYSMAGAGIHNPDYDDLVGQEWADHIAQECYDKAKDLAFIVWEEYRKLGWHWCELFNGRYEIRLPSWTRPCIWNRLLKSGLNQDGRGDLINGRLSIEAAHTSKADLKLLLAPLLEPGTRLMDQRELANRMTQKQGDLF